MKEALIRFCIAFTLIVVALVGLKFIVAYLGWKATLISAAVLFWLVAILGGYSITTGTTERKETPIVGSLKRAKTKAEQLQILLSDPGQRATPHEGFLQCPCWNCQNGSTWDRRTVTFDEHCREQGYATSVGEFLVFPFVQVLSIFGLCKPFNYAVADSCPTCKKEKEKKAKP